MQAHVRHPAPVGKPRALQIGVLVEAPPAPRGTFLPPDAFNERGRLETPFYSGPFRARDRLSATL